MRTTTLLLLLLAVAPAWAHPNIDGEWRSSTGARIVVQNSTQPTFTATVYNGSSPMVLHPRWTDEGDVDYQFTYTLNHEQIYGVAVEDEVHLGNKARTWASDWKRSTSGGDAGEIARILRSSEHATDVATPRVVQDWALVIFTAEENDANAVLHRESGHWRLVKVYGGAADVSQLKEMGVPPEVGRQLLAQ